MLNLGLDWGYKFVMQQNAGGYPSDGVRWDEPGSWPVMTVAQNKQNQRCFFWTLLLFYIQYFGNTTFVITQIRYVKVGFNIANATFPIPFT